MRLEPKYSSASGLRIVRPHNIYPSWIDINLSAFFLKPIKIFTSKIPRSKLKGRAHPLNSGVGKCPCRQTFDFTSERDLNMKLR